MRLWSLHPRYLDRQWLLALWREGLLAQKVLLGRTMGYRNHPQLIRFRSDPDPVGAIGCYLSEIALEAERRWYRFDASKIELSGSSARICVTHGQMLYEKEHLSRKLAIRDPERIRLLETDPLLAHPIFSLIPGDIEKWEIVNV